VGVDVDKRSIELAKHWLGKSNFKSVHFFTQDLMDENPPREFLNSFDLVSCHGVLSYVPDPKTAFVMLKNCLKEDGSLYVGVNGKSHFGQTVRTALNMYGISTDVAPDDLNRARLISKLCEDLKRVRAHGPSTFTDAEFAGEVFGEIMHNESLGHWMECAEEAGLHFVGSMDSTVSLSRLNDEECLYLLLGQEMATIHALVDEIHPAGFHKILFSKHAVKTPSFLPEHVDEFLKWRPIVELWDREKSPSFDPSFKKYHSLTIHVPMMYENFTIDLTHFHAELLRRSDGKQNLGAILEGMDVKIDPVNLLPDLSRLYYSGVVYFLSPEQA
jgi:SAM-dependent methyltransferase